MPVVSLGKVRISLIIALPRLAVEELAQAFAVCPVSP